MNQTFQLRTYTVIYFEWFADNENRQLLLRPQYVHAVSSWQMTFG
jgi:hypothetical protein